MFVRRGCKIFLFLNFINCQNAPIITSQFQTGDTSIEFDRNTAEVTVVCNPTDMCVSIDEQYFINNRQHVVRIIIIQTILL